MAVGSNISYKAPPSVWRKCMFLLLAKRNQYRRSQKLCVKAGVPATNTANDNPNQISDICLDTTNGHVYICTAYSSDASATTWTQIA